MTERKGKKENGKVNGKYRNKRSPEERELCGKGEQSITKDQMNTETYLIYGTPHYLFQRN